MLLPRLLLVSLATVFGGCATYEARDIAPAATQTQLDRRRLDEPGLARFLATHGQPADGEWDLGRLTLAALYFNPELDVARAQLAEAEAGVRTAEARPNPSFTFTPGRSDDTTGGISPWILGYALSVPLELAGKRAYRTAEAQHRADVSRLELAARAWSLHSAVRRALIELQGAAAEAELWRTQLPLVAQMARMVEAQVHAGDGSPLDAALARSASARAELAVRAPEHVAIGARSRLAETLGVSVSALEGVRLSFRGLEGPSQPFSSTEARTWAAQNRADLLAALAAYAAAQAALQGEIARQYPNVTLGPGYQLDQGEGKWSLGLGITLPVFHQNQGPIAAAEARRTAAAAHFLALQNRVLAEVDRAAADYTLTLSDFETARSLRATLERQTKLVRARHSAGDTSRLDLARAEIELADQARIELAVSLRARQALGIVEDAVQRPLAWPEAAWRTSARNTESK